jgi:hypothetical protein
VQCTALAHCTDGEECTDDDCANNMCAYPPKADGEPCSQGICLSGVCGTAPDLVVSSISIPSTTIVYGATPWTHVEFTVENVGSGPVTGVDLLGQWVNITRDGAPHFTGGYFRITYSDPLDPGETATHHPAVGHDSIWPLGHYTLQVQVDHTDLVPESDETNNVSAQISFDVVAP